MMKVRRTAGNAGRCCGGLLLAVAGVLAAEPALAQQKQFFTTRLVTFANSGEQGNGTSLNPFLSAGGRYVAFASVATNLVDNDTNNAYDTFVRDTWTGVVTRESVSSSGQQGNDSSFVRGISADGRYVLFVSSADNLVSEDTNGAQDMFVRDRLLQSTERIPVGLIGKGQCANGTWGFGISADGRYVVYSAWEADLGVVNSDKGQVFRYDRQTNQTLLVSGQGAVGASDWSTDPSISADGNYVVFISYATDLGPVDTNGFVDVYGKDMTTGQIELLSVSTSGVQGDDDSGVDHNAGFLPPYCNADGSIVVFTSYATTLVNGDTNGMRDTFARDRRTNTTTRANVSSTGEQGNSECGFSSVCPTRPWITFSSWSTNLVPGDTNGRLDVFVHDLSTGKTMRASVASNGAQGNDISGGPTFEYYGSLVAFQSLASNLVVGDANGQVDCFVRSLGLQVVEKRN